MRDIIMHKEEIFILISSLIILSIGYWIQISVEDSNAFSRSGALIVSLGIFFGYLDFRKVHNDKLDKVIEAWNLHKLEKDTTDHVIDKVLNMKERGDKRVALIDISILIFGTLVWGFGDLLF